jgi:hypothetical protein
MEHKFRLSYLRLILDIHSFPLLDGLSMIQESEKKKKEKKKRYGSGLTRSRCSQSQCQLMKDK